MHFNALPIVLVRNEAYWIEAVLRPLAHVFGTVIVGDTGSTDQTCALAAAVPGVELIEFGELHPQTLGQARHALGHRVAELGYPLAFQVDGDELYNVTTLRWLQAQTLPGPRVLGFTTLCSLDADAEGRLWELADVFSRAAVFPAICPWQGEYPFEWPSIFADRQTYHYFTLPPGYRYHGLHLHRLVRSPHDARVYRRNEKRLQFAMQERTVARTVEFDLVVWQQGNSGQNADGIVSLVG